MINGFAPVKKTDCRPAFLRKFPPAGCDLPEQGGITGTLNKKFPIPNLGAPKLPSWGVCYMA